MMKAPLYCSFFYYWFLWKDIVVVGVRRDPPFVRKTHPQSQKKNKKKKNNDDKTAGFKSLWSRSKPIQQPDTDTELVDGSLRSTLTIVQWLQQQHEEQQQQQQQQQQQESQMILPTNYHTRRSSSWKERIISVFSSLIIRKGTTMGTHHSRNSSSSSRKKQYRQVLEDYITFLQRQLRQTQMEVLPMKQKQKQRQQRQRQQHYCLQEMDQPMDGNRKNYNSFQPNKDKVEPNNNNEDDDKDDLQQLAHDLQQQQLEEIQQVHVTLLEHQIHETKSKTHLLEQQLEDQRNIARHLQDQYEREWKEKQKEITRKMERSQDGSGTTVHPSNETWYGSKQERLWMEEATQAVRRDVWASYDQRLKQLQTQIEQDTLRAIQLCKQETHQFLDKQRLKRRSLAKALADRETSIIRMLLTREEQEQIQLEDNFTDSSERVEEPIDLETLSNAQNQVYEQLDRSRQSKILGEAVAPNRQDKGPIDSDEVSSVQTQATESSEQGEQREAHGEMLRLELQSSDQEQPERASFSEGPERVKQQAETENSDFPMPVGQTTDDASNLPLATALITADKKLSAEEPPVPPAKAENLLDKEITIEETPRVPAKSESVCYVRQEYEKIHKAECWQRRVVWQPLTLPPPNVIKVSFLDQ